MESEPPHELDKSRAWFFTWNNPPDEDGAALRKFFEDSKAIKYAFQLEKGAQGTLHYQGGVRWKSQMRIRTIVDNCKGIWLRPLKDEDATRKYVTKSDTHVAGPWVFNWEPPAEIRPVLTGLEGVTPYPWQQEIMDLTVLPPATKADGRAIWWYWSEEGCKGKTSIANWLYDNRNCEIVEGSYKDVCCQIADRVNPEKGAAKPLDVVVYDFSKNKVYGFDYGILESICDGMLKNTKYRPRTARFAPVHMIVFANEAPDTFSLSKDRWHVHEIL